MGLRIRCRSPRRGWNRRRNPDPGASPPALVGRPSGTCVETRAVEGVGWLGVRIFAAPSNPREGCRTDWGRARTPDPSHPAPRSRLGVSMSRLAIPRGRRGEVAGVRVFAAPSNPREGCRADWGQARTPDPSHPAAIHVRRDCHSNQLHAGSIPTGKRSAGTSKTADAPRRMDAPSVRAAALTVRKVRKNLTDGRGVHPTVL